MNSPKRENLRKAIDALERRALKMKPGQRPASRVALDRAHFRIALVEAYTAGKLKAIKVEDARPKSRAKRRAS